MNQNLGAPFTFSKDELAALSRALCNDTLGDYQSEDQLGLLVMAEQAFGGPTTMDPTEFSLAPGFARLIVADGESESIGQGEESVHFWRGYDPSLVKWAGWRSNSSGATIIAERVSTGVGEDFIVRLIQPEGVTSHYQAILIAIVTGDKEFDIAPGCCYRRHQSIRPLRTPSVRRVRRAAPPSAT